MLLPVAWVLSAILQVNMAADIPRPLFGLSDPVDQSIPNNSNEVGTTLGPANSVEVATTQQANSAEVSGTQQQNSAETLGLQQKNSAEIVSPPTTINPFNSAEIIPTNGERIKGGSTSSAHPDNTGIVGTAAGTQPFPTPVNGERIQEGGSASPAQPGNTGIVGTAVGTQPFFPKPSNQKLVQNSKLEANAEFSSQTSGIGDEKGTGNKPIHPNNAGGSNKIAGIEPIFQLLDNNRDSVPENVQGIVGVEPIFPEISESGQTDSDNVPNSLRDALADAGIDNQADDPLVGQAKQYFMSIWNLEANRLGAPYLEVTDVWPEIGMVYMPTINQMSSKIQNSKPVKEAAERLKSVWDERKPSAEGSPSASNVLSVLTDFISAWGIGTSNYNGNTVLPLNKNTEGNYNSYSDKDEGELPLRIKRPQPTAILPPKIKPIRGDVVHPANHRPANPNLPVHRPAIRQNIDFESAESLELSFPLPLYTLHRK